MLDNCYDLDKQSQRKGQIIHYVYNYYDTYGSVPQACPNDVELKKRWNTRPVSHQWSNLYSAFSIGPKLRSLQITGNNIQLTDNQITLLSEVEHNRWNMEKLLLGYRKPTAEEEAIINSSKEKKKEYKEKRFVHPDIRPYDELSEGSKNYDKCITAGIPLVVKCD